MHNSLIGVQQSHHKGTVSIQWVRELFFSPCAPPHSREAHQSTDKLNGGFAQSAVAAVTTDGVAYKPLIWETADWSAHTTL